MEEVALLLCVITTTYLMSRNADYSTSLWQNPKLTLAWPRKLIQVV